MAEITWWFEAKDDLKLIHEYISSNSEFYANRMIEKIFARVWDLETQPQLGRVGPEFEDKIIRELIENPYRIIYKIKSVNEISIVRIYHSARLLKSMTL